MLFRKVDESWLKVYMTDLAVTEYRAQFLLTFSDLIDMHHHILRLLSSCAACDTEARNQLLGDDTAIRQIILLLAVAFQGDEDVSRVCSRLWQSVFELLSNLLMVSGRDVYSAVCPTVVKCWDVIASRIIHILQEKSFVETELWLTTLNFVGLLLSEEAKLNAKLDSQQADVSDIVCCLDTVQSTNEAANSASERFVGRASGSVICQSLVHAFDAIILKPQEQFFIAKAATFNALKVLLAVSSSAKTTALEVGLLETLCDHVRHLHTRLNLEALDLTKAPSTSRKKMNPVISELVMTFDLLRNFMFDSEEVKCYASKSPLANLIHCTWSWSLTNNAVMSCTLALLSAYTAHCPAACSSLAFTSPSSLLLFEKPLSASNKYSSNSLVHCLIRLIQKETANPSAQTLEILRLALSLAATLTISSECRGIMWKSNFLHEFSGRNPRKTKKTKLSAQLDGMWLQLLVNLSFSTEGQNMILKIEDALTLLVEFASNSHEGQDVSALLVLRNLCFHAANKPKVLANAKLLPLLLRQVESGSRFTQSVACSALLALLYNNQKAKGLLKNALILRKLEDAYSRCSTNRQTKDDRCAQTLRDIMTLLHT